MTAAPRRKLALVAILHAVSFIYFIQGGGANQNSNIGEVRQIVERGHFALDQFSAYTVDVVQHDGRTYSNKTPSATFLAAPPYWLFHGVAVALGADVRSDRYQHVASQVISFLITSLWGVLLGQLLFFLLGELYPSLSENDRVFLAAAIPLATMVFPYATVAMLNEFETFWTTFAIYGFIRWQRDPGNRRLVARLALAYAFAFLADPVLALVGPAIGVMFLLNRERRWSGIAIFVGVFAACMIPWLVYNRVNFGSFTTTNRALQTGEFVDPGLFLGVFDVPDPLRVVQVLFWSHRSLFPTQAFIMFFIPGLVLLVRGKEMARGAFWTLVVAIVPYLVFIMTFNGWHGGDCYGPRYFMPAVIILVCWSIPIYQRFRKTYVACMAASYICVLMVTAVDPVLGFTQSVTWPFRDYVLPNFMHGKLALDQYPIFPSSSVTWISANFGEFLGLSGRWSLAPLLLLHLGMLTALAADGIGRRLLTAATAAGAVGVFVLILQAAPGVRLGDGSTELADGIRLYNDGRYDDAIAVWRKASAARPEWADPYINICAGYNQLHRWDDAIASCEKALALDPANQLAQANLAWAHQGR